TRLFHCIASIRCLSIDARRSGGAFPPIARSLFMADANARDGAPLTLYRHPKSGHCHRVELMLALLEIPYATIDLDMAIGAHKAPHYLRISPLGQVPAIEDNGVALADSNAILTYLVERYGDAAYWRGADPLEKAQVQRWLS